MRKEIANDVSSFIRNSTALMYNRVMTGYDSVRFVFYEEKHPILRSKIDWLEEKGMVTCLRRRQSNSVSDYKFSDKLYKWLKSDG